MAHLNKKVSLMSLPSHLDELIGWWSLKRPAGVESYKRIRWDPEYHDDFAVENIDICKWLVGVESYFDYEEYLCMAAEGGHLPVVKSRKLALRVFKFLISQITEWDVCDYTSAVYFAAENNHTRVVKYLLRLNKPLYPYFESHDLIKKGNVKMIKYLAKHGLDMVGNTRGRRGTHSVRVAAVNGHLELVKFLVNRGADAEYALEFAIKENRYEMAEWVVDRVGVPSDDLVKLAARMGRVKIIAVLIARGGNPEVALEWGTSKVKKAIKNT